MRIAVTIAALVMAASPVLAESHTTKDTVTEDAKPAMANSTETSSAIAGGPPETMVAAEAIEGAVIYSLGTAYDQGLWDENAPFGPVTADWAEIGEVEDLILGQDGKVLGVTVDVGGFLGLGERTVLVPLEDLKLVQNPDNGFYIVTRMERAALEVASEVDGVIGR